MTWTYNGSIDTSERDWVRFRIGDTDTSNQQLTDEELAALITDEGSKEAAALAAVEGLLASFSRKADKSVGDLRISYSQSVKHYERLAKTLRSRMATRTATPLAGGISRDRKDTVEDDSDRVQPAFRRDQFTFPGTTINDDPETNDDDDAY